MNLRRFTFLFFATMLVARAQTPAEKAPGDLMQFLDGSVLHGQLNAVEPERGIRWQHPDAVAPLEFAPSGLDRIAFGDARSAPRVTNASSYFRLRNGDEFAGELISIDDEKLTMRPWFASELSLPRAVVAEMRFQTDALGYEGPTGLEGWQTGVNLSPWEYRDGMFLARSNCVSGREMPLTDAASLQFDLSWTGPYTLYILFYAEIFNRLDYTQNAYVLQIYSGHAALTRVFREPMGVNIASLGQSLPLPVRGLSRGKATFELRANRPAATLELFCNGQSVGRWKDDRGFTAQGTGVGFYGQPQNNSTLTLRNIRVLERRASVAIENVATGAPDTDSVQLLNRDRISGTIKRFDGREVQIASGDLDLKIPASRIGGIRFRDAQTNRALAAAWDARVALAGGGAITLALKKCGDEQIEGMSALFGPLAIESSAVRELIFNPSKPRELQPEGNEEDWEFNPQQPRASLESGNIVLRNGDHLAGAVQAIDAKTVRWQRADALQSIEWQREAISRLEFNANANASSPRNEAITARVELWNGDRIDGALVSGDGEQFSLETDAFGRIRLPRQAIRTMRLEQKRTIVFSATNGLDGWTRGKVTAVADAGEWSYGQGAFYAVQAASMARDVNLPPIASIQFDLAWKGQLQEALALYTDYLQPINLANKDSEPDFGAFYSLQINSLTATLVVVEKNKPLRTLEIVPVPGLIDKNRAHFEIRANKTTGRLALIVDGKLIKEWAGPEFASHGTSMRFVHQGLGSVRLSRLIVSEWDGFTEKPEENVARTVDLVTRGNTEQLAGQLESIQNGSVSFLGSNGKKYDLPLTDVRRFDFAHREIASSEADSTIFLLNGQRLHLNLERWSGDEVSGTNPLLGKLKLRAAAVEEIDFESKTPGTRRQP